jgi:mannose-6-phosphate isomerase-like protein (cupin superfamily)
MAESRFQTIIQGLSGAIKTVYEADAVPRLGQLMARRTEVRRLRPGLSGSIMIILNRDAAIKINTRQGSVIRPLIDRTTSGITQCSLAEEVLPPGCAVPPHYHRELEEIYYVLSGNGLMTVGDESREVGPGDAIYVPRGERHTLKNTGNRDIKLLLVCGPAFFYEDEIVQHNSQPATEPD